jgi:hypothetical protein
MAFARRSDDLLAELAGESGSMTPGLFSPLAGDARIEPLAGDISAIDWYDAGHGVLVQEQQVDQFARMLGFICHLLESNTE